MGPLPAAENSVYSQAQCGANCIIQRHVRIACAVVITPLDHGLIDAPKKQSCGRKRDPPFFGHLRVRIGWRIGKSHTTADDQHRSEVLHIVQGFVQEDPREQHHQGRIGCRKRSDDRDGARDDRLKIKDPPCAIHDVSQNANEVQPAYAVGKWWRVRLGEKISQVEDYLCHDEVETESGGGHLRDPFFNESLPKPVKKQRRNGRGEPNKRIHCVALSKSGASSNAPFPLRHETRRKWQVDMACRSSSNAPFPLTPALSLRERES